MTQSVTFNLSATPTPPRTLHWDGSYYMPSVLRADTSAPRIFKGWADPNKYSVSMVTGDTWVRTGGDAPPDIILDTDASSDIDDCFDAKVCMVYHQEGIANLLGIACTTSNAYAPGAIRGMGDYYGLSPAVSVASYAPIGTFDPSPFGTVYEDLYNTLSHTGIGLASTVTSTTTAYRTWLAGSAGGVRIIMTGFAKGIRAALQSSADGISALNGNDLFAAKVARIYAVAGLMPTDGGDPEFNLEQNPTDWDWLATNCPVPITWVGIEIGNSITPIGGTHLSSRRPVGDPCRLALTSWGTNDRIPWGVVGCHYAVEGQHRYNFVRIAGTNAVNSSTGANTFTAGAGTHEYLTVTATSRLADHHNSILAADTTAASYTWNGSAWT